MEWELTFSFLEQAILILEQGFPFYMFSFEWGQYFTTDVNLFYISQIHSHRNYNCIIYLYYNGTIPVWNSDRLTVSSGYEWPLRAQIIYIK